jgi:hypothetical protein
MISPKLLEIERSIHALSVQEQLWLLESIARQIREREYTKDQFADVESPEEEVPVIPIADVESPEEEVPVIPSQPKNQTKSSAMNDEFASSEIL